MAEFPRVPVLKVANPSQKTQLYRIVNSRDRNLYVLASDVNVALTIANTNRHVLSIARAKVYIVNLDELEKRNPKWASSVRRAISSKIQGIVEDKDGFSVIDSRIFSPISSVSE